MTENMWTQSRHACSTASRPRRFPTAANCRIFPSFFDDMVFIWFVVILVATNFYDSYYMNHIKLQFKHTGRVFDGAKVKKIIYFVRLSGGSS